jgi:hypothetical protein
MPKEIVNYIPYGKDNAISREQLMYKTGLADRQVRHKIELARRAGALINNDQDGSGYYQSIDLDALARQYKQDTARAMAILNRRSTVRKILRAHGREV